MVKKEEPKPGTESNETELGSISKLRKIAFSNLNYSVEIISTFENDDLKILSNLALSIFSKIQEDDKQD
jgi:hypothetical protein